MKSTTFYGLRRRLWRVRRSVPRVARPLSRLVSADPPKDPIFVIGCPRAGTSVLLDALRAGGELSLVQSEGHILWDEFHHPKDRGWDSDALSATDVSDRERAYVHLAIRLFARGGRFVDKTPANCLRVGYLAELFPGATFVFLGRRGSDNVSSLMEAWRARPRFVRYRLPEPLAGLGELSGDRWSLVLVPGWRKLREASLAEICARQYVACNEAVLEDRAALSGSSWIDVRYETLVAAPVDELSRLYGELGLRFTDEAERFARNFADNRARTALTAPRAGKWRDRNADAIAGVASQLDEIERRLGYTDELSTT